MAFGLRKSKVQISLYPTREEKKRWAALARMIQQERGLEKYSLTDITREAMARFVQEYDTPAQESHVKQGHA